MKYLFTVYDAAAGMFLDPFVAPSVEFAIRSFRQAVNTKDHQFNLFPEDYTLFQVGEFEPDSGALVGSDPHNLGVAITMLDKQRIAVSDKALKAVGDNDG